MGCLANCGTFIWNSETKQFCGRGKRGWIEICAFFIVFYAILLAYFCGMISLFFCFISERYPTLIGSRGFLESPGLSIRPLMRMGSTDYTTLIYLTDNINHPKNKEALQSLRDAVRPYKLAKKKEYAKYWQPCTKDGQGKLTTASTMASCIVRMEQLTQTPAGDHFCKESQFFGLDTNQPCILVRINKIYDWKPKPIKSAAHFPPFINRTMTAWKKHNSSMLGDLVYLRCYGEDPVDRYLLGKDPLVYMPQAGYPVSHFPYRNQYGYLPPAVFIKFKDLRPNVVIKMICKIYARNVRFSDQTWEGGFHFQIYFKSKKTWGNSAG